MTTLDMPRISDKPISPMKAIRSYFFSGNASVPMKEFNEQWKALTAADRDELSAAIVAETGDTLTGK